MITGGAGFLGSHLCDRLLADGASVICVDNFPAGAKRNIDHARLPFERFNRILRAR
jgi:nucleoside-diphosphate-sugar epimerase